VSAAEAAIPLLPGRLDDLGRDVTEHASEQLKDNLESVRTEMEELSRQYADMKGELKEDAWLARFERLVRTSAREGKGSLACLDCSVPVC